MNLHSIQRLLIEYWMWISCIALFAIVVWDWISIRRSARKVQVHSPSCGKCGYSVTGLQRMVCPECGSDLREAGIVDGGVVHFRFAQKVLVALVFTACIAAAAKIMVPIVYPLWPVQYRGVSRVELSLPGSNVYLGLKIEALVQTFSPRPGVLPVQFKMTLTLLDTSPSLTPTPREFWASTDSGSCKYTDRDGNSVTLNERFSEQAVLKWFDSCGISAADPKVILEARRIANLCLAPSRTNPVVSSHLNNRTSDEVFGMALLAQSSGHTAIPMSGAFVYSIWGLLWLTGIVQLIRVGRVH